MKKNILSENMSRFGTKNINESAQKKIAFHEALNTIREMGLQEAAIRQLVKEQGLVGTAGASTTGNIDALAKKFVAACKGAGTDETAAIAAVRGLKNANDFAKFAQAVKSQSGYSFSEWFLGDFSAATDDYETIANHIDSIGGPDVRDKSSFARFMSKLGKDLGIKTDKRGYWGGY